MRKAAILIVLASLALMLALPLQAHAAPARTNGSWSDEFTDGTGIDQLNQAKLAGGGLTVAEPAAQAVGEGGGVPGAVPGESAVYATLGVQVGSEWKVYCGTAEKGHLVEFNVSELYQEGYEGTPHWGISDSRGQAVTWFNAPGAAEQKQVLALASFGSLVYGGTAPDGYLFSFDPAHPGQPCVPLGQPAGAGTHVAIDALAVRGADLLIGSANGHLYRYSGAWPPTDLGDISGGSAVRALAAAGTTLYAGCDNGHVYSYSGGPVSDMGSALGSGVRSLATSGTDLFAGTAGGRIYRYTGSWPPADIHPGGVSSPVSALTVSGSEVYAGAANGHLYRCYSSWLDMGVPHTDGSGSVPVNALTVAGPDQMVYGGTGRGGVHGEGHLFSKSDAASALESHGRPAGTPSSVTGITALDNTVFFTTESGHLWRYPARSGSDPVMQDLGQPAGGAVRRLNALTTAALAPGEPVDCAYSGGQNGHLYRSSFSGGTWHHDDMGMPSGAADSINALAVERITSAEFPIFIGSANGHVYSYSGTWPPTDLGDLSGSGKPVRTIFVKSSLNAYAACSDGAGYSQVFKYDGNLFSVLGNLPGGSPVNGLAVVGSNVYAGCASGTLYRYNGSWSSMGARPGSITGVTAGSGAALFATDLGNLYIYDETTATIFDLGPVAGGTPVRAMCHIGHFVFMGNDAVGTDGGGLFAHADALLADRGWVVESQFFAYSMVADSHTAGRAYAGTYHNAHFLVIDTATGNTVDRGRPENGEREIEDIIVTGAGKVFGSTYAGTGKLDAVPRHNPVGGRVFEYDPVTGAFTDWGRAPAPDETWYIAALCEGSDHLVYGATCNSDVAQVQGRFFSFDPADPAAKTDLGVPIAGQGPRSLVLNPDDGKIYGGTWKIDAMMQYDDAHLYRYDNTPGGFTDLGEPPVPVDERTRMEIVALAYYDGVVYGGEENGYLFGYHVGTGTFDVPLKPAAGTTSVNALQCDASGVLWLGTCQVVGGVQQGHVASYDTANHAFHDLGQALSGQDWVISLALSGGTLFGGARGSYSAANTGRLFNIDTTAYRTGAGPYATSVDIAPGVRQVGTAAGSQAIKVLCRDPRGGYLAYAGGGGETAGARARLYRYSSDTGALAELADLGAYGREVLSMVGTDTSLFIGTGVDPAGGADARLLRYDLGTDTVDDLGSPQADAKGVFSLALGQDGNIYCGTGDVTAGASWQPPRLVRYDGAPGAFTDLGQCGSTKRRLAALAVGSEGKLYGATAAQFTFDEFPAPDVVCWDGGSLTVSKPYEFLPDVSVNSMAASGGKVYFGCGPSGKLISFDPATGTYADLGYPAGTDRPVYALSAAAGKLYGSAGQPARLFVYDPAAGFTDKGAPTYANSGAFACTVDNLDRVLFGTAGDAALAEYNPAMRFIWSGASFARTTPQVTSAQVDVLGESGNVLLSNIATSADLSGISSASNPGIKLKARLQTDDSGTTPRLEHWGVTWQQLPGIERMAPGQAHRGVTLDVWGSNFGDTQGTSHVSVGGADSGVLPADDWKDGHLRVTVPEAAASGQVVVTVGGQASNTATFTLEPQLDSALPAAVYVGNVVTADGAHFGNSRSTSAVYINGSQATVYPAWGNAQVKAKVPPGASGGGYVVVSTGGGVSNALAIYVVPYISSLAPTYGNAGTTMVTVSGYSFGNSQGASSVWFGSSKATGIVSWKNSQIKVTVPAGAYGRSSVKVYTTGGASNAKAFDVRPYIGSLSPASGGAGTNVTLSGSGFGNSQSGAAVYFGTVAATTYTSWKNTQVKVKVPSGVHGGVSVRVTTSGGNSNTKSFTVP